MKVLLIHPPWKRLFNSELAEYPVGLSYIAAVLNKSGHESTVYNADYNYGRGQPLTNYNTIFDGYSKMTRGCNQYLNILNNLGDPLWQEIKKVIEKIVPDIVGISAMTVSLGSALNVARIVKGINPQIPVILGGKHPSILSEQTLKNQEVDIVIRGEGEYVFAELLNNLKNLGKVKGISYKKGENIIHNPPSERVTELDNLPFPRRQALYDLKQYPKEAFGILFTSRGCPNNCIFCASPAFWQRRVYYRSPENVIEEIREVKDRYGTESFNFQDDCLLIKRNYIERLCDLLIRKKLKISWSCLARVDLIDENLAAKMKQAGCSNVSVGIESGNNEILKKIGKRITVEEVIRAVKILKKYYISVMGFFMFGFPWETRKEIDDTLNLIKKLDLDRIQYNFVVPLPGTELFSSLKSQGLISEQEDWNLFYQHSPSMFFNGNFSREEALMMIAEIEDKLDYLNFQGRSFRNRFRKRFIGRIKYYLPRPKETLEKIFS